ncbi:hypothetical protein OK142_01270 [Agrobacterium sp. BT-220-3]|nr:hypothetical protein [Agrobacterium sp. BT-220-3]
MANTTWYGDGLSTATVGSRTVIGTDTGWLTEVAGLTPIKAGDKYGIHVGRPIVIEQIISDTELLLADDWPGPAQTDAPYKVELTSPTIAAVEAMRRLLASLSNGNLDSLSEITVGTDDIPIGIGPGVFGTIKKLDLAGNSIVKWGDDANGGMKIKSGDLEEILQWGFVPSLDSFGGAVVVYPQAFPNAISGFFPVILTDYVSGSHSPIVYQSWDWGGSRLSSQTIWCRAGGAQLSVANVRWFAIGR